ncbi:MFS transporter [Streptomyces sp. HNM0574]|uniref:MFS transporter n=1 Tax=Streptomyces sp. HNM0574 TaxID=2714954 RepID=UPI00146D42F9|nr:MFS transporter [Streptomyces sp. HNM0574]NLU68816.1 MFS transporter [Streptomyces sp. HNM0574]
MTQTSPEASAPALAGPREWAALAVLTLPVLLISVDMTVLGFAVPHLSEDLSPDAGQLLWIVDIYSFMLAALLVTMGALGDRIGRRRLLLLGTFGFGLASVAAAFAPSTEVMIAARALLGLAGGTLMPSTLSLIRGMFPDETQRKLAIAVWSSALSAGSALGPLLGGALLEFFWWGSLFLINAPVTLLILVLAPVLVRESRASRPGAIDPVSVLLSVAAMFPFVYGIKKLAEEGAAPLPLACLAVGIAAGTAFVRRQLRRDEPLLDVRLFAEPKFSVGVGLNLVTLFAMIGALFFLTQYLQIVLGISPFQAGLVLLPGMLLAIAAGFLAVGASQRAGLRAVLTAGLVLMATGFGFLMLLPPDSGVLTAAGGFALICFGMGLTQTLTNDAVLSAAPEDRAGAASAVSETGYELGAALGIAVLGSILSASYRSGLDSAPGVPESALTAARDTLGGAESAAAGLSDEAGATLLDTAHTAFVDGIHVTSAVAAALLIAAAAATAVTLRKRA